MIAVRNPRNQALRTRICNGTHAKEDCTAIRSLSGKVVAMYIFGIACGRGSVTTHMVSIVVLKTMRATGSALTVFR